MTYLSFLFCAILHDQVFTYTAFMNQLSESPILSNSILVWYHTSCVALHKAVLSGI